MLKQLLQRQWKKALGLILFFCAFLLLQADGTFNQDFYDAQHRYMAEYDLWDRETFFVDLNAEVARLDQKFQDVDNFVGYEGVIPEGSTDRYGEYTDYNMLLWRAQMYDAPGEYADTAYSDFRALNALANRLRNVRDIREIIANQEEIMNRGIRRGGVKLLKYQECLRQLQQIEFDYFPVVDTLDTDRLLDYLETDYFIIILVTLIFFAAFSTAAQEKITNLVLTTRTGMRRFAWAQVLVGLLLTLGVLILYYAGVVLIYCRGELGNVVWQLPIQAIRGYDSILLNMRVWQYVLLSMGLKGLYCIALVGVVLLVSLLSKNNVIAAAGAILVCGGIVFLYELLKNALVIGCLQPLVVDLCFVNLKGFLIPHTVIFALAMVLVAVVCGGVTVLLSKHMARRWVK